MRLLLTAASAPEIVTGKTNFDRTLILLPRAVMVLLVQQPRRRGDMPIG